MQISYNKHKTPIAITSVGLTAAIALAIAPLIMAESDADKLASKNASDIQKLIAQIEGSESGVQEQIASSLGETGIQIREFEQMLSQLDSRLDNIEMAQSRFEPSLSYNNRGNQSENTRLINNRDRMRRYNDSNAREQNNYQTYDRVIDHLEELRGTLDALL